MPKGVTQDQVNAAIDSLVAAGERPTIERVRAALGTGSPNTVTRMLDAWWTTLHERLTRQQAKVAVPDAPADVATAATRLWQLALEHAAAKAEQGTSAERDSLARSQSALASERDAWQQRIEAAEATSIEAARGRAAAELRLADLQRLLDQHAAQLADVQGRLVEAQVRGDELMSRLEVAQQAVLAARAEAAEERSRFEASHRAAEDRWMQEVDRARQDEAKTAARLQQAQTAAHAAAGAASVELSKASAQLHKLEQDLARKDSRISTLDEQLDRLHQRMEKALVAKRSNVVRPRPKSLTASKRGAAKER